MRGKHALLPRCSQRSPRRPREGARATEPGSKARWERTGQEARQGDGSRAEALRRVRAAGQGAKTTRLQGEGSLTADPPPPSCPVASCPLEQRSLEDAPRRAATPTPGIWGSSEPGHCSQGSTTTQLGPSQARVTRPQQGCLWGCFTGGLSQLGQAGPRRAQPGPQSPAAQRLAEAALPEDSLAGNTGGQSRPGPLPGVWLWTDHIPSQSLAVPSGHWGDGRRPLQPREPLQPRGPAAGSQPLCPCQDAGPACPWRMRQQESGQSGAPSPAQPLHAEPQFPHL